MPAGLVDALGAGARQEAVAEGLAEIDSLHQASSSRLPDGIQCSCSGARVSDRADHRKRRGFPISPDYRPGFAADGHGVLADHPGLHQLFHHGGDALGAKESRPQSSPGCMFNSESGIPNRWRFQSLTFRSIPACRAMACRCGGAFVDPPIAAFTTMAFSKLSRLRMSLGFQIVQHHLHDALAGFIGHVHALAEGRGPADSRSATCQRLGHGVRVGGAHGVAMAGAGRSAARAREFHHRFCPRPRGGGFPQTMVPEPARLPCRRPASGRRSA